MVCNRATLSCHVHVTMRLHPMQDPPYDANSFAKTVTADASPEAGSAAACVPNMRKGWQVLLNAADSESGRQLVSDAMRLCPHSTVDSKNDGILLAQWLQNAWDYLAMVNRLSMPVPQDQHVLRMHALP